MNTQRIYIDFNAWWGGDFYSLSSSGTLDDLRYYNVTLKEGLALSVWSYDADLDGTPNNLIAEGVVHYSREHQCWVVKIDRANIRHESDKVSPDPG
jgi:hypothetical protein